MSGEDIGSGGIVGRRREEKREKKISTLVGAAIGAVGVMALQDALHQWNLRKAESALSDQEMERIATIEDDILNSMKDLPPEKAKAVLSLIESGMQHLKEEIDRAVQDKQ